MRIFFYKQRTAYEMRISDWSSDVCSSDLHPPRRVGHRVQRGVKLGSAITFEAAEHIAGQAFAVQPHHRRVGGAPAADARALVRPLLRRTKGDESGALPPRDGQQIGSAPSTEDCVTTSRAVVGPSLT